MTRPGPGILVAAPTSPRVPVLIRLRNGLRKYGILRDPGTWIDPASQVLLCAYPRSRDLANLQRRGIRHLVNVDERAHALTLLAHYDLTEIHLPVPDFHAPTQDQLAIAVRTVVSAVEAGERVAIHCAAGLGRSGTVAACYLVELGRDWTAAIDSVRAARPGAIETADQVAAVAAYAKRQASS
jgi:atypical dual specificity phosphatase